MRLLHVFIGFRRRDYHFIYHLIKYESYKSSSLFQVHILKQSSETNFNNLWLPAINVNHVVLQTSTNLAVFLVFILNVYNLKLNVLVAVASVLDIFVLPSLVSIFRYIFPNSFSIYHDCYQVHVLSLPKSY